MSENFRTKYPDLFTFNEDTGPLTQEDRVKDLKSTDRRHGALLRVMRERGELSGEAERAYVIGVTEGIFDPAEQDKGYAGMYATFRGGKEVQASGLTRDDEQFYRSQTRGGGRITDRLGTAQGEFTNSVLLGTGDRLTGALARAGVGGEGSRGAMMREMGRKAEEGGARDGTLTAARLSRGAARERNPVSALGGEIAGFIGPGVAGMAATSGAVRFGARRLGVSAMSRGATPVGTSTLGRVGRYAKDVLPRAAAGGAVDGAIYGATVGRSNVEADEGRDIKFFSAETGGLALRDAGFGALFGALSSPVYRLGRAGATKASDIFGGVDNAAQAGGKSGMRALEHRLTPGDRRNEVLFENMQRAGLSVDDAQYVRKALDEGRLEDAKAIMDPAYTKALIMIDKRLRAEKIPLEALENKMREIAYAGEDINEFFFEIAALAGSGKTQSLANAIATVGGPGKNIAIGEFDQRGIDAFENVKGALNKAFGVNGTEFYGTKAATAARGAKLVNEAYERAEKSGRITDETWGKLIDDAPGMSPIREQGMRNGITGGARLADAAGEYPAGNELRRLSRYLDDADKARGMLEEGQMSGDQGLIDAANADLMKANERLAASKPSVSAFKYIDQEMTDIRYKANQPGSSMNARGIAMTQEKIRALTDTETQLKEARDLNSKFEFADEAYEEGRAMFRSGTDIESLVAAFERQIAKYDGMSPEIAPALIMGFIRGAEDAMSQSGGIGTVLRRLHGTPRAREKLGAMLDDAIAQAKAAGESTAGRVKARKALIGGDRSVTYVDGTKATVRAPGRIAREASMQDSKNRTIRGSATAERFEAVREQDVFEDTVGELVQDGQMGFSALAVKYGTAVGRRIARSGIYDHDVNKELAKVLFRGGRNNTQRTIDNLRRLQAARAGKGDLDQLSPHDRQKIIPKGGSGAAIANSGGNPPAGGGGGPRIGRAAAVPAGPPTASGVAPKRISARQRPEKRGQVPTFTRANGMPSHYFRPGETFSNSIARRLGRGAIGAATFGAAPVPSTGDPEQDRQNLLMRMATGFIMGFASGGKVPAGMHASMFGGMLSKGADRAAFKKASNMRAAGTDLETIRRETGWFVGPDGQWKYEFDDTNATTRVREILRGEKAKAEFSALHGQYLEFEKLIDEGTRSGAYSQKEAETVLARYRQSLGFNEVIQASEDHYNKARGLFSMGPLRDVLEHPTLYDAYPEIGDVEVHRSHHDNPKNYGGVIDDPYNPGGYALWINSNIDPDQEFRTMLHEVQHLIQFKENFGLGGSASDPRFMKGFEVERLAAVVELRERLIQDLIEDGEAVTDYSIQEAMKEQWMSLAQQNMIGPGLYGTRGEFMDHAEMIANDPEHVKMLLKMYDPVSTGDGLYHKARTAFQIYERLTGEVESRLVEKRMDYTPQQRVENNPITDAEYPPGEQLEIREYNAKLFSSEGPGSSSLPQSVEVPDGTGVGRGSEGVRPSSASLSPLDGAPRRVTVPGVGKVDVTPHAPARAARDSYMKNTGRTYTPIKTYKKVDEERAGRIAQAFEEMPHAPDDPKVLAAYNTMIDETIEQYRSIEETGLKISFIEGDMPDPYAASPRLAIEDVKNNNHLWVYPTDSGYGQSAITPEEIAQNPLLRETDIEIGGRKARANDIFRVVHDYFGHIAEGNGFRADGEENAWRLHASMYSPEAVPAMTSETRGQNSWLNYGPHGAANRNAKSADTVYADQKIGLLPDWVYTEGLADDYHPIKKGSGEFGEQTALERARGEPNELQLLTIRKRQIQYDQRIGKKDAPGSTMPARTRIELDALSARIKELKSGNPPIAASGAPLPSFMDMGRGIAKAEGKAVDAVSGAIEGTRRVMAGSGDSRHYGPGLKGYGIPEEVDPTQNIYNQAENYPDIARDVADRAGMSGGDASGRMAVEEVSRARTRRVARTAEQTEVGNIEADRRSVIEEQGRAGQALADAIRERDNFFGEQGNHRNFRTDKARRREFVRLQNRARDLARAADAPMRLKAPTVPEMPADLPAEREQRMMQELRRVETAGPSSSGREGDTSRRLNEAYGDLPSKDPLTGEYSRAPRPTGGYEVVPTRLHMTNRRLRPLGTTTSAIDDRATDLAMNPAKAQEAADIASEYGDGFRPSRGTARAVGYGGATAVGAAGYGLYKKSEELRANSEERMRTLGDFSENLGANEGTMPMEMASLGPKAIGEIQKDLAFALDIPLEADLRLGSLTTAAIIEFQRMEGLRETGNANDPETKKRLLLVRERRHFNELRRWEEEEARRLERARSEPLPN